MPQYTFYLIKSNSPVAAIDVLDLEDDGAARLHAQALCEGQKSCIRVEIWQEERLVVDRSCAGGMPAEDRPDEAPQARRSPVGERGFAMARCPVSGRPVRTHARLTKAQIDKLKTGVVYWCPLCRCAHEASRADLIPPDAGET